MKPFIPAFLVFACAFALPAQQPKVADTQFKSEPVQQNLTATMDRLRHASEQLWLGYEVPAFAGRHMSTCSDWSDSQSDDGCCGEYHLEDEGGMHSSSNGQPPHRVFTSSFASRRAMWSRSEPFQPVVTWMPAV